MRAMQIPEVDAWLQKQLGEQEKPSDWADANWQQQKNRTDLLNFFTRVISSSALSDEDAAALCALGHWYIRQRFSDPTALVE